MNESNADWKKTKLAIDRVKSSIFYEEFGVIRKEKTFQGRPIIGRDKTINGGVYLGAGAREAIVVDDSKDQSLNRVYQALVRKIELRKSRREPYKSHILIDTWKLVTRVMPFDSDHVNKIGQKLPEPDTKILLGNYMGGGVCRHQALLTGYLLERLSKEGYLRGRVSVDRNYVEGKGGHAWTRYENSIGDIYILDSAQKYIGKLNDMSDSQDRWFYEREEDKSSVKKLLAKVKRAFL